MMATTARRCVMAEHPNVGFLRKGYEAFAKRDMATLRDIFSQDVVWHHAGTSPISGEYRGRDAVFAFFARLAELSGGTFRIELHDVLGNDEHGVALSRETASRQGKQLDSLGVHVYHVRDGKITEAWSVMQDQRRYDDFWS
jgi:ketosteroid isomerase-like protein